MSLAPGTRLGVYEISSPSRGGWDANEDYRARDTELGREVAITVLSERFTAEQERFIQLKRDAKLLESLRHPTIAQIYGCDDSDGVTTLAREWIEAPTLADRIAQGPIPVEEAVAIAKQIADALDTGHESGIIHGALNTANIKIQDGGTVKLVDYGLTRLLDRDRVGSSPDTPSPQAPIRANGAAPGTAPYLSPEQLRGERVDKRTDIWAFGAIVYEMLTGRRAFEGGDVSVIVASILENDPEWEALPDGFEGFLKGVLRAVARGALREGLRKFLARCLAKDPKQRSMSIAETQAELESIAFDETMRLRPLFLLIVVGATVAVNVVDFSRLAALPPFNGLNMAMAAFMFFVVVFAMHPTYVIVLRYSLNRLMIENRRVAPRPATRDGGARSQHGQPAPPSLTLLDRGSEPAWNSNSDSSQCDELLRRAETARRERLLTPLRKEAKGGGKGAGLASLVAMSLNIWFHFVDWRGGRTMTRAARRPAYRREVHERKDLLILRVFGSARRTFLLVQIQEAWQLMGSSWTVASIDYFLARARASGSSGMGSIWGNNPEQIDDRHQRAMESANWRLLGVTITAAVFLVLAAWRETAWDRTAWIVVGAGWAGFVWLTIRCLRQWSAARAESLFEQSRQARKFAGHERRVGGLYPFGYFSCHNDEWQHAVSELRSEAEVVLLDLRGYAPSRAGMTYEIEYVLDTFPLSKTLMIVDATTDRRWLQKTIADGWQTMHADSPNAKATSAAVNLFVVKRRPLISWFRFTTAPDKRTILRLLYAL